MQRLIPILILGLSCLNAVFAEKVSDTPGQTGPISMPEPYLFNETMDERTERMRWWNEARFGMFIHWGVYAVPAGKHRGVTTPRKIGEWIMNDLNIPIAEYEKFANHFNPIHYNADSWVKLAKEAGMKYIVITSKHHDGFCLWDSELTEWDVVDSTPYGKDLLKPLADACRTHGIKLCFYYSIMDWHHADAQAPREPYYNYGSTSKDPTNPNFARYIENYMKPQLEELMTEYGDIGVIWFDGEWIPDYTTEMGKDIYAFLRSLDGDVIINNRVDKGRDGMAGMNKDGIFAGDFGTPEKQIPDTGMPGVDWESCLTMNNTWGFRKDDSDWKSGKELTQSLIEIASKGGNLLLNIGPQPNGSIPNASIKHLRAMGKWMDVYGEAIYGTSASPVKKPAWGCYTVKGDTIYAHVFNWPKDSKLSVKGIGPIKSAFLLGASDEKELKFQGDILTLPTDAPDSIASVIALKIQ